MSAAAKSSRQAAELVLRLYVAGDAPNSSAARANLEALRAEQNASWEIEIVDVLEFPERALTDAVVVTPTLVRVHPGPTRRIIGSLSEREAVLGVLLKREVRVG